MFLFNKRVQQEFIMQTPNVDSQISRTTGVMSDPVGTTPDPTGTESPPDGARGPPLAEGIHGGGPAKG